MHHPVEKLAAPIFHSLLIRRGPRFRAPQQSNGINEAVNVTRFDESSTAPGVESANALRELQIRIHPRFRIQKHVRNSSVACAANASTPKKIIGQCKRVF